MRHLRIYLLAVLVSLVLSATNQAGAVIFVQGFESVHVWRQTSPQLPAEIFACTVFDTLDMLADLPAATGIPGIISWIDQNSKVYIRPAGPLEEMASFEKGRLQIGWNPQPTLNVTLPDVLNGSHCPAASLGHELRHILDFVQLTRDQDRKKFICKVDGDSFPFYFRGVESALEGAPPWCAKYNEWLAMVSENWVIAMRNHDPVRWPFPKVGSPLMQRVSYTEMRVEESGGEPVPVSHKGPDWTRH
jgi:hypothetical protein